MNLRTDVLGELTDEQLRVERAREALDRDGAKPAGALDLLAAIVEDETWRQLTDADGRPYGRFSDFAAKELACDAERLRKVLDLGHPAEANESQHQRMEWLRKAVLKLIETENPILRLGANQYSGSHNITPTSGSRGTGESYNRRRLRRDRPDLLERVDAGELSASAAAIKAGWQRRKVQVIPDDPESAARTLRKHMPADKLARLKELL